MTTVPYLWPTLAWWMFPLVSSVSCCPNAGFIQSTIRDFSALLPNCCSHASWSAQICRLCSLGRAQDDLISLLLPSPLNEVLGRKDTSNSWFHFLPRNLKALISPPLLMPCYKRVRQVCGRNSKDFLCLCKSGLFLFFIIVFCFIFIKGGLSFLEGTWSTLFRKEGAFCYGQQNVLDHHFRPVPE